MNTSINKALLALGVLALTAPAPALAGDESRMPMRQGQPGMMGGGMGMSGKSMEGPGHMRGGMMGRGMGHSGMMGPGMMHGGMMGGMGMEVMEALDLSQEQVQELAQIRREMAQKHGGMRADLMEQRWQLHRELDKERPDPEKVGDLYGQMAELRQQMVQDRVSAMNRFREALSEEQRKKFREMREYMHGMHGGMEFREDE